MYLLTYTKRNRADAMLELRRAANYYYLIYIEG